MSGATRTRGAGGDGADGERPAGEPERAGLWRDERASAAVEFVVLIPVYLLLLTGLFMVGNLALARQALVAAVRYQAWNTGPKPYAPGGGVDPFFGPYEGEYSGQPQEGRVAYPVQRVSQLGSPTAGQLRPATLQQIWEDESDRAGGDTTGLNVGMSAAIAAAAYNNATQRGGAGAADPEAMPFTERFVRGTFRYRGISLLGTQISQSTTAAVLLPREHTRPEYQERAGNGRTQGWHPFFEWGNGRRYYDPTDPKHLPLAPVYPGYFDDSQGVWDVEARIRGSEGNEWAYFDGQSRPALPSR